MSKIKAIFFDQDETLIHPSTGLYEEYVTERAKDFAKAFNVKSLESAKKLAFKMKKEECNDSTITLYDRMGISRKIWYDKINKIRVKKYLKKDKELINFLDSLKKRRIKLFLLTNSPTLQTKKILAAVGVSIKTFRKIFSWVNGKEPPKPSVEPFKQVFKKEKIKPSEALMVGNEIMVDLKPAFDVKIRTVGINPEKGPKKYMDFKISKLEQLYAIIDRLEK